MPEHLSDDDDDAKLTTNQKVAMDMDPPPRLKKTEKINSGAATKNKGKGKAAVVKAVEFDEPITTAQRLEALHLQEQK